MRKEYVSASRLMNYRTCPYSSKNSPYIQGQLQAKGEIMHEMMASFLMGKETEAEKMLKEMPFKMGLDQENFENLSHQWEGFKERKWLHFPKDSIIAIESDDGEEFRHNKKMFAIPFPMIAKDENGNDMRIIMRGAMDLVLKNKLDDGITILDWKTGFKEADKLQADLYALVAYLKYGKKLPIKVRFVYTNKDFYSDNYEYDKESLTAIFEYLFLLSQVYLNDKKLKRRFNSFCSFCNIRQNCNEYLTTISKIPKSPILDKNNFSGLTKWDEELKEIAKSITGMRKDVRVLQEEHMAEKKQAFDHKGVEMIFKEKGSGATVQEANYKPILDAYKLPPHTGLNFSATKLNSDLKSLVFDGTISSKEEEKVIKNKIDLILDKKTSLTIGKKPKPKKGKK